MRENWEESKGEIERELDIGSYKVLENIIMWIEELVNKRERERERESIEKH